MRRPAYSTPGLHCTLYNIGIETQRVVIFFAKTKLQRSRMPSVNAAGRQACYRARDSYYECKVKNPANQSLCDALKKEYHESCLPSWVSL